MRIGSPILALVVLAGCSHPEAPTPAPEAPPAGTPALACGKVELVIGPSDLAAIGEAFGPDGMREKACAIFAGAGDLAATSPQTLTASLPTGETVTALARPTGGPGTP
jgi:hypothetical protein